MNKNQNSKYFKLLRKNVIDLLKARNMSQKDLSNASGLQTSTINQILKETNENPSLFVIEGLCKGFGVHLGDLFEGGTVTQDHPIQECYRRIGELVNMEGKLKANAKEISLKEAALALREILSRYPDFPEIREILTEHLHSPPKK